MKILAAGDIHGDISQAKKLAKQAEQEKVDVVVLAGDLTFAEMNTEGLLKPFVEKKQKIILIPGNHESVATADFLAQVYGATNLHGYSIYLKDAGFFGCGSGDIGFFQIPEKEIYDLLKKGFEKIKNMKKKILITHIHPVGSVAGKLIPGSSAVAQAIKKFKPDIAICSHIHEAEGIEEMMGSTKLFVVGKKGKIINI